MRHCFAISAYKESPYLETCIRSLLAQRTKSTELDDIAAQSSEADKAHGSCSADHAEPLSKKLNIIICTSTPNDFIRELAERYSLRLYVREGASSLREDWNFAVETAVRETKAELVTIAHQDDVYAPEYLAELWSAYEKYPDMSLFCTRYRTIDADGRALKTKAEAVKRILRLPLRLRCVSGTGFIKRLPLIFGNGIGCPTCSYNIKLTGLPIFRNDYHFVIDWETLLRLSGQPGRFICVEKELLSYRVHQGAETCKNIADHNREREETQMFCMIWPGNITRLLMHFYKSAYTDYKG